MTALAPERITLAQRQFMDWRWRIANLYWITNKEGRRVKFQPNWAQQEFMRNMWGMNLILKARQLGMTTFLQLFMLDQCVFNSHKRGGTVAHNLEDAKAIFRDKVKFPYDNLPEGLRAQRSIIRDSAVELALSNNSSIRVGTSLRSGTLHFLHVSELGKIAAKFPEKAREIRTGALNTVQAGQWVAVESTAEGQEGDFYELCQQAQTTQRTGARLTKLDFRFHFFPWQRCPEYRLDPEGVTITAEFARYFADLELKHGVVLDAEQRAWYVKKAGVQLDDMKREFPSTSEEAFSASIEGAYYGELMAKAERAGRVGTFPAVEGLSVHTAWDIGRSDYTSIWFWQDLLDHIRLVGYLQDSGEGMPYYAAKVASISKENGWSRTDAVDWVPHDARVTEWGSNKSRIEQMFDARLNPRIPTAMGLHDGINACRAIIPICEFDEAGCGVGLTVLKQYRKSWNDVAGCWSDTPFHNEASHGADGFRTLACAHRERQTAEPPKPRSSMSLAAIRDEMIAEGSLRR